MDENTALWCRKARFIYLESITNQMAFFARHEKFRLETLGKRRVTTQNSKFGRLLANDDLALITIPLGNQCQYAFSGCLIQLTCQILDIVNFIVIDSQYHVSRPQPDRRAAAVPWLHSKSPHRSDWYQCPIQYADTRIQIGRTLAPFRSG